MPLIDMPLHELKEYMGSTPKPAEFDAYWDEALKELAAVPADLTLTPADYQVPFADCFDMTFTSTKGARIYCKCVKPKNAPKPMPAVIRFHGYTADSGDWSGLLHYAYAGMMAVSMDCRGQGGRSEDVGGVKGGTLYGMVIKGVDSGKDSLYFKHVFLDTVRTAQLVLDMEDVDSERVYAAGGSQGGALTIACAALEPRIAKAVPVYPFLSDYRRVWEMDLAVDAYVGIREYFRHFDPNHENEDAFFETMSYIDIQHLAPRIQADVLMVCGLMDTICPPSTQFAAYNKMTTTKDYLLYPDFGHEYLPGLSDKELQFLLK